MQTSDHAVEMIKHFEGFSPTVYICAGGWPTIGYGHVVKNGERYPAGISRKQADALIRADLAGAENAVKRLVRVPLTQGQFDALVSFTFNLGSGALQRSTLRQKLNRGDYQGAAAEFGKWVFAGGKRLKGLVNRRNIEVGLFNDGSLIRQEAANPKRAAS